MIMASPTWLVSLIKKGFPFRFVLARLSRLSPVRRVMDKLLFEGDDIYYLPRDNVIHVNQELPSFASTPLPSRIIDTFIKKANHAWIMNKCICRDASKCKEYPIDLGCLFLGDSVVGINPSLGKKVSKEEARAHVQRCRDAGLVQLIGKNRLDASWLMVPEATLLTICNCCPCCCLWRMLPALHPDLSANVKKLDGVSIRVTDGCTGCGACEKGICFVDAIQVVNGKARISGDCRGCGRCASACPGHAIKVTVTDPAYLDKPERRIDSIVSLK